MDMFTRVQRFNEVNSLINTGHHVVVTETESDWLIEIVDNPDPASAKIRLG